MQKQRWVSLVSAAVVAAGAMGCSADKRQTMNFDDGWKFHLGNVDHAEQKDFADASWRSLSVPHDYAIEGPAVKTDQFEGPFDHASPAEDSGGYLDAGPAWYRKTFTVPASAKGKRVMVDFDGVYMDSDVYLNGKLLGNHPYGYTSFHYDLTPGLNFDGPNTIAVHTNVVQPCSRWYSGAGIYRDVRLTIVNPVHIAPWGVYVTTPDITDASATVKVVTSVQNDAGAANVSVVSHLVDPQGNTVAQLATTGPVDGSTTKDFTASLTLPHPERWSVEKPTLYHVVSEVSVDGKVVDSVTTPIGIRTIQFTKDNGFLLNGKRLQIQGVCDHHDLGALGSAYNFRALQRQLELLKSMGCNAIRTSHNPPVPALLTLADQMGFVVMDESFDEWKHNKMPEGYGRFFDEWSERDLVSMIHRDRNHPSIILWSIGNEIPEQADHNGGAMAKRLSDIAHREDPTRPTVAACNQPGNAVRTGFADALGVFGINYNIHQYDVQKGHVLIASETASALSTRGEYGLSLDEKGNVKINIRPEGSFQCTSYDLDKPPWGNTAEESLLGIKNHPWMAGEFVWTGFDYIGEPTPYEWPSRSSYFGILDLAGFPKDRFYIYQSQWSTKPMVHLLPHWNWAGFEGKAIPVWAFTNADSVELTLNGQSLGKREAKDLVRLHYEWKVPYAPGTLKAIAMKDGQVVATDTVTTAGAPAKLVMTADRSTIHADGSDLSYITVKVEDKDGNICPNAGDEVSYSVSGPATIAGLDNGDPTNHEAFQGTTHKTFHGLGLVILRSTDKAGIATLTATAGGLSSAAIPITLKD
jgi:beta-galactosidase